MIEWWEEGRAPEGGWRLTTVEWVCTVSTGGLLGKGLQRTVGREFVEEGEEEEEVTVHCVGTACSRE